MLAPLQGCVSPRLPLVRVLVTVPGRLVLYDLLLFDIGNEPRRKKCSENGVLRNACELRCCVLSVLQWSSFSVVLLTISSSLFFYSSPLVPTALKLSLIEDSHSFYFGRRKDGKSSVQAIHEWKSCFFYFFLVRYFSALS